MPELKLPLDLSAVGAARRWVGAQIEDWSDDGRRAAMLVTSELVANVVLHARTEMVVKFERDGDGGRVAVADGDRREPVIKQYGEDASTGRGLLLISRLSSEWGVDSGPEGKEVWARVHDRPWGEEGPGGSPALARARAADETRARAADETRARAADEAASGTGTASPEAPVRIRLIGAPLSVMLEAEQHHDELLREFSLLTGGRHLSARLDTLAREVAAHFGADVERIRTELDAAAASGHDTVDLTVEQSRAGWEALDRLTELLGEADEHCERLELLTLASSPAVRRLRRWYRDEVRGQMGGASPTPWNEAF